MKGTRGPINQGSFNPAAGTRAQTHKAAHRENSLKKMFMRGERGGREGRRGREGEGERETMRACPYTGSLSKCWQQPLAETKAWSRTQPRSPSWVAGTLAFRPSPPVSHGAHKQETGTKRRAKTPI